MTKLLNKSVVNLIVVAIAVCTAAALFPSKVFADNDCEKNYGGGETCLVNKRFKIEKWVRKEGSDEWKDEVTIDLSNHDDKDKYVEFKIKVTNLSDKEGNIDFDDMKMLDKLPSELTKIGGDGLTEDWDNFKPGESKTFIIKADIDEDEKDKHGEFKKCAVNKAEVFWKKEFEGSDTATVCWKKYKNEIKELPKTGAESAITGVAGAGLILAGAFINKVKKIRI